MITREERQEWRRDAEHWLDVAARGESSGRGHSDERIVRLLDLLDEYENAINWDTTCLNCAHLWGKNYEQYARLEKVADALNRIERFDGAQSNIYGSASRDAVALIREALRG